jgi:hypothetical protein
VGDQLILNLENIQLMISLPGTAHQRSVRAVSAKPRMQRIPISQTLQAYLQAEMKMRPFSRLSLQFTGSGPKNPRPYDSESWKALALYNYEGFLSASHTWYKVLKLCCYVPLHNQSTGTVDAMGGWTN